MIAKIRPRVVASKSRGVDQQGPCPGFAPGPNAKGAAGHADGPRGHFGIRESLLLGQLLRLEGELHLLLTHTVL